MLLRMARVLALLWAPAVVVSNLVVNGGFEMGFTGWTTSSNSGYYPSFSNLLTYPSHSGFEAARIGIFHSSNGISHAIATVPSVSYALDFWLYLSRNGGTLATFSASWDGVTIFSVSGMYPDGFPSYMHEIFTNLTASTTSTPLSFSGQGGFGDQAFVLDDVSVVATPEPGTIGLVLGGLAVFGIAHRLRRRTAK